MNIILEIGLNHIGSIHKLNQILNNLCILKFKFSLTLQLIDQNFFIKNKISSYYLPEKILLKKLYNFKKRTSNHIGIATNYKVEFSLLSKYKIDFIKILSSNFDDQDLIDYYLKNSFKTYISTGKISTNNIIQKHNNFKKKYQKLSSFIITDFNNKPNQLGFEKINKLRQNNISKISYGIHYENSFPGYLSSLMCLDNLFIYIKPKEKFNYPDNLHALKINSLNRFYEEIVYSKKILKEINFKWLKK